MLRFASAVVSFLILAATPASAASFSLNPVTLSVSASHASAIFTLTNNSAADLRLQITSFAWNQRNDGEMLLAPTDEVVAYPQLFTIPPLSTRRVRVAATGNVAAREKTYRLVIDELPALAADGSVQPTGLSVRMRIIAPLFLVPEKDTISADIIKTSVHRRKLIFTLANAGSAHFMTTNIKLSRRDGTTNVPINEKVDGWYVLAGGERDYVVPLPAAACVPGSDLSINLDAGMSHLSSRIHVSADACST